MAYLDPKNDLTFKKVFGEHPDLLKSLLNAVLPLQKGQEIESLEYLSPELTPIIPEFKHSIVDVRCKDNFGRHFIVEMQMLWTDSFKYRVLFNASKAYVKQLGKGKKFESLQPVYALSFVNESFQPDPNQFYHHYQIIHTQDSNQRIEGLEFVFVELPNFKAANFSEKKMMVLWLRFLTEIHDGSQGAPAELLNNENTSKALDILQESAFTPEELAYYEKYWDLISTERTYAAEKENNALKKGKVLGIEEGKKEMQIETALRVFPMGFDDITISNISGLTIPEIQTLRQCGTLQ